jgi:hypothetical protein
VYVRRERVKNKGGVGSGWTYVLFMYGTYVPYRGRERDVNLGD